MLPLDRAKPQALWARLLYVSAMGVALCSVAVAGVIVGAATVSLPVPAIVPKRASWREHSGGMDASFSSQGHAVIFSRHLAIPYLIGICVARFAARSGRQQPGTRLAKVRSRQTRDCLNAAATDREKTKHCVQRIGRVEMRWPVSQGSRDWQHN